MKLKPATSAGVLERASSFEDIPMRPYKVRPIARAKTKKPVVTDINKLSTTKIVLHLMGRGYKFYKRHQLIILEVALVVTYTWLIVRKFS